MKRLIMMIASILTFCCNTAMQAQNAVLTLDDVELKAGEGNELSVNMTNPIPVTYVGADIILPEGCSFEQYYNEEDGEYYDLEMTTRKHSSHDIATNHINGVPNHLRFVMFSMKNSNIKDNDGALIKFKIKVGKDLQPDKYEIQIAKQDIVTADSQQANELWYTTKSTLTIKPNEIINSINKIISSDKKVDVYNQNGIKIFEKVSAKDVLESLPKGMYVINGQKIHI